MAALTRDDVVASGYVHRSAGHPGPVRVQAWAGCRAPCRLNGLRFSPSLERAGHNVMEAGPRQRGALSSAAEVRDNPTSWPRRRPAGQKEIVRTVRSNQVAIPSAVVLLAARAARQAEQGKS